MLMSLLRAPGIVPVPGVFDGLSALLAEQAGFQAVFLSGASLSYARLGRADAGLVTASELADACARIADRVGIPILVDGDSGFGNAVNLQRTIRLRNPYVDPMNAIQVELLRAWRGGDEAARRPLLRSIAGIAAALRNTG